MLFLFDTPPKIDVSLDTFKLHCVPMVNLFKKEAGKLDLKNGEHEFMLSPAFGQESTLNIHSVLKVSTATEDESGLIQKRRIQPFYALSHELTPKSDEIYWKIRREESSKKGVVGTETYLSFRDRSHHYMDLPGEVAIVKSLCTNRSLARKLSAGSPLELLDTGLTESARCLKTPTAEITPSTSGPSLWELLSTLSVNHLSLMGDKRSLEAFKSIIRAYNFNNSAANERQLAGLKRITPKKTLSQSRLEGWRGFTQGGEINLEFDPAFFKERSSLLFGAVLNRFFPLYFSENAFSQTVLYQVGKESEWVRFEPVPGYRKTI